MVQENGGKQITLKKKECNELGILLHEKKNASFFLVL